MCGQKRLTVFTGHYGSGKTEAAINYALKIREETCGRVFLIDMDIVNPFFRSADAAECLKRNGVELIASVFAGSAVENPAIPSEINTVFENKECYAVFDVGGGGDGAIPLGRYHSYFEAEEYDMFFVLNERRSATNTAADAAAELAELEFASRLKYTGIVNNTHLKSETTSKNILKGFSLAKEVSEMSGVPLCFSLGVERVLGELPADFEGERFPIKLYMQTAKRW